MAGDIARIDVGGIRWQNVAMFLKFHLLYYTTTARRVKYNKYVIMNIKKR